jgi:hypothetical protein
MSRTFLLMLLMSLQPFVIADAALSGSFEQWNDIAEAFQHNHKTDDISLYKDDEAGLLC